MQQSVCVLPQRHDLEQQLEQLKAEIISGGGEADLLAIVISDETQVSSLIDRFQQQADQEYQEFLGRCQDFHQELERERQIDNFSFAELDENEAELTKLKSWLSKIHDRDLLEATGYSTAIAALKDCEQDFQRFSQQVYKAQDL
nr:Chromate resistance protein ChrB [Nodosilinea sp. LEGE 06152]